LSFSKAFSNSSNSSSKLRSVSTKYINLDKDLQPILGSLGQFLSIKINLSKFFDCKHLLKLVRISINDFFFKNQFDIQLFLRCFLAQKCRKHVLMFFPPLQWTLNVFNIHLITPKNWKISIDQFRCWLTYVGCHFKKSKLLSSSTFWSTTPLSNSTNGCKL
jgi:hypothetical protein